MNSKMNRFSFFDARPKTSRTNAVAKELVLAYVPESSIDKSTFIWRVSLSERCMDLAGLKPGDHVAFECDADDNIVHMFKHPEGMCLCKHKKTGTRAYARFYMSRSDHLGHFYKKSASEVESDPSGRICFKLV